MLLGSLLGGAGAAAGLQARFGAVDLATTQHRARDLSLVVWASTVGSVAGPNLLPWTTSLAASLGLPKLVGPYLFGSVMLACAALFAAIRLRPDPYVLARREEAGRASHSLRSSLQLLRQNHRARQAVAAVVIGHIAMVSVMVMTPVHMGEHSASLRVIGLVISVHVLGMYAFSPVMGWLSDKIGRLNVVRIGVAILLLSLLLSGTAQESDHHMLGVGLFLLGLGWSATLVAGSTLLSESVDVANRPTAQGASDLLMNGGAALGGALAGVIIAVGSFAWLNALTAIPVIWLAWLSRKAA
jgi:predicted MFS family arabinose efflux permease